MSGIASQRRHLARLLVLSTYYPAILAQSALNSTGSSNRDDPSLRCRDARWTDVLAFFIGNYVAHAATIKSPPGCPSIFSAFYVFLSLASPTFGLKRGMNAIMSRAILADTELQTAARARALCMVVERPPVGYRSS